MYAIRGQLLVTNEIGLHARPCAKIVRIVKEYPDVSVTFAYNQQTADGGSIIDMMILAAGRQALIDAYLEGPKADCKALWANLQRLFKSGFKEDV
ncbi:MAG: HPr family phosphocarrier protein [Puniceicoccales bacterium]|jgi:phosphotransferase system HPr (HPr) family protein|nr:HPr family phosphocarrier protein [Puniceicoccales bacterium]